jgi:molybdate transport system permease protein
MDWSPLWLSLKVASTATLLACAIGIPLARLLSRRWPGKGLALGLVNLPLVLPPTVLGYFLLVLFGRRGAPGHLYEAVFHQSLVFTWQGAALAASIVSLPLLVNQARVAFDALDAELAEAARLAGASEGQVFWHITAPLAGSGVASGISLAFARSLGDFGGTLMVAGDIPHATQTMPLAIYDALQTGDTHTLIVFVVIASALSLLFTLLAMRASEVR